MRRNVNHRRDMLVYRIKTLEHLLRRVAQESAHNGSDRQWPQGLLEEVIRAVPVQMDILRGMPT